MNHHSSAPAPAKAAPLRLADSLGCNLTHLARSHEVAVGGMSFLRKSSCSTAITEVETHPAPRGQLLGLSLSANHWRNIHFGHRDTRFRFGLDSIYLRDFEKPYRAELSGEFDFVLVELPASIMERKPDEAFSRQERPVSCTPGQTDQTVGYLMRSIIPSLERGAVGEQMFLEQVGHALRMHLRLRYGGGLPPAPALPASLVVVQRAQEMLRGQLDGNIPLDVVAQACGVSRSQLFVVFRKHAGCSPYEWMQRLRIEMAEGMLRSTALPLAEVAHACGFADQSHFTRVFSQRKGVSPGRFRQIAN